MKSRSSNHPTAVRSFSPHRLESAFQIAAALFAALLLVSMDTAPAAAQKVPGHLKIAFTSTQHANCPNDPGSACDLDEQYGELYIMNRNGSDQTRITFDNLREIGVAWSPDGTKIAYHSPVNGPPQIFLMNPDGTGQMQLTNFALGAQFPDWSPDGKKIVFQTSAGTLREIYVINVDGTGLTNLTNNSADDRRPDWSPDGGKIAFQSNRDGNNEIYVMSLSNGSTVRLTCDPASDAAPDWSPDGSHIVFHSDRPGHFELYTIDAANTACGGEISLKRLTNTDCRSCTKQPRNQNPAWSPDGRYIAFESDRDFAEEAILQVWVMNADSANQRSLTSLPGESGLAGWGWEADVEP
jgi:Tol biopolymer transport system component